MPEGLGLRVDLVDESEDEIIDAEAVIVGDGDGADQTVIAGTTSDDVEPIVADEADEFGDLDLGDDMSIETADEFKTDEELSEGEEA